MFKEVLRDVVERTEGGIAGLVMGFDGIPLEQYQKSGSTMDVVTMGMEYSVVLGHITKAAEQLDTGAAHEVAIRADRQTTVIRYINSEYFIALTLAPHGNIGKGRFLLRMVSPKLLDELT